MKIAISGKGGVGKTTLAALMAKYISQQGRAVIAVDADPDANLASALGLAPPQIPEPIGHMRELIAERTGSEEGYGSYFKINPYVDDIPEKYCAEIDSIKVLVLGGVQTGGGGCICPEGALLKALVTHLILGRDEMVILDMEAGIEHLGRGIAQSVTAMIVVVDAGARSLQTARSVRQLANDIGIEQVVAVANRLLPDQSVDTLRESLGDVPLVAVLPYDPDILRADMENRSPYTGTPAQKESMEQLMGALGEMTEA